MINRLNKESLGFTKCGILKFSHISTFFCFQSKILETFDYFEDTKKIYYFECLASKSKPIRKVIVNQMTIHKSIFAGTLE